MLQVQILSPNSIEDQKKGFHQKLKGFCSQNRVKTEKKRSSLQFGTIFGHNLGFIRADHRFFV